MTTTLDRTNNLAAYTRASLERAGTSADYQIAWAMLVALSSRVSREDWDAAIAEATA